MAVSSNGLTPSSPDAGMSSMAIDSIASPSGSGLLANNLKPIAHVEVRLASHSTIRDNVVRSAVQAFLEQSVGTLVHNSEVEMWEKVLLLAENVVRIRVAEFCEFLGETGESGTANGLELVRLAACTLQIHIYQPDDHDEMEEFSAADPNADDEEKVMAATVVGLPSASLDGVWDSLIYEDDIKVRLLNYIYTTLRFSDADVDFNIVTWNRVVLLHGPPGTGKTSLCRALAQKLAIRLSDRYTHGKLVEINSHSLFSKWFSESGKLVQRLFSMVTELVEDDSAFVVILIDEVESLTAARSAAINGSEPSDALRVVNALLTQLDKLKHRKNVLIMTTSNISEAIDSAFMDRADIKQYIGLPPPQAIYWILQTCLSELIRVELVSPTDILDWSRASRARAELKSNTQQHVSESARVSAKLCELSSLCQGMSGRSLRRLPILAHARYIGAAAGSVPCSLWLEAMLRAIHDSKGELSKALEKSSV